MVPVSINGDAHCRAEREERQPKHQTAKGEESGSILGRN